MKNTGLGTALTQAHRAGKMVVGICGGYQMLGRSVEDPDGVESRVAATAGLGLLLAGKFLALRGLPPGAVGPALLVAHPLSRAMALTYIFSHRYARANEDGKAPVAIRVRLGELAAGLALGALPLLVYAVWQHQPAVLLLLLLLLLLAVAKTTLARYF